MMQIVHDIESRAKRAGIPLKKLCDQAGVSVSTFNRWKAGTVGPTLRKIQALSDELDRHERGQDAA